MKEFVEFGWASDPIGEQFPTMDAEKADHFTRDKTAISRLFVRGLLTQTQRNAAYDKLTKAISKELRK